jgi:hypothetical protein
VPVLLLADPADQIVPIMTAQRLVSELPYARLRLISDAGHHLPRRAPGAVAEAVAEFIATLAEAAPARAAKATLGRVRTARAGGSDPLPRGAECRELTRSWCG